jgi:hypothetical protein
MSVLEQSDMSRSYTKQRRDANKNKAGYTTYKTGEPFRLNTNITILNSLRLEDSTDIDPLGLAKKRMFLADLKQNIIAMK